MKLSEVSKYVASIVLGAGMGLLFYAEDRSSFEGESVHLFGALVFISFCVYASYAVSVISKESSMTFFVGLGLVLVALWVVGTNQIVGLMYFLSASVTRSVRCSHGVHLQKKLPAHSKQLPIPPKADREF